MTELKCKATHENNLLQDSLYIIICNFSHFRAQNSFQNIGYSANKTGFAQNLMNSVSDAILLLF